MPHPTLKVGSITLISLSDGTGAAPPTDMMPSVPADNWKSVSKYLTAEGLIPVNFGSFLSREGDSWTLIDTGFGNRPESRGGALFSELEKADVSPDVIGRVILTHLHGDHLGGNTIDVDGAPVPAFKNARYVVQRADWGHFQQPIAAGHYPYPGLGGIVRVEGKRRWQPLG